VVLDPRRNLDARRHIDEVWVDGSHGVDDIIGIESAREAESKAFGSIDQNVPRPRLAVAGTGVEEGKATLGQPRHTSPVN
jgi:hypothetical protein